MLALGDGGEGVQNRCGRFDTGRVSGRTAQDEVVVDEGNARSGETADNTAEAVGHEGLFLALGVDQDQVGIAGLCSGDGLAGAGGLDFHGVAVLGLEDGQQVAQQAGVLDGSGGGQTDGLGLVGSLGDLAGIGGGILQNIEQVLAVLGNTVLTGQLQCLFGQQPLDQSISTDGVHIDIVHSIAVSVHKGRGRVHSNGGVGVEHLVVSFHQDDGINHHGVLTAGSLLVCGLGSTGCQTQNHNQNQQQGNDLLHILSSICFENKKRRTHPQQKGRKTCVT